MTDQKDAFMEFNEIDSDIHRLRSLVQAAKNLMFDLDFTDKAGNQNEALVQVYAIVSTVEKEMEQLGTSTHEFYFQCVKPELDKLAPLY